MNNRLTAIATFLRVAEAGSFSATARQLGTKQLAVNQQIAAFKQKLDVVLLHRTTRAMMLIEQGERYRRDMQWVLNAMQRTEGRLDPAEPQFQGWVHAQLPSSFGSLLLPHLLALQKQYPELYLMLSLDDRIADLITEGMDVALRLGHEPPPSRTARVLAWIETALFAAPGHYAVQSVDGLAACPHVRFNGLSLGAPLRIISADETRDVQVKTVFRANTNGTLLQALESSIGIGGMQRPLAAWALRAGRLVPVLADWRLPDRFLYTVYPDARFIPPRVRSVITLIEARLSEFTVGS